MLYEIRTFRDRNTISISLPAMRHWPRLLSTRWATTARSSGKVFMVAELGPCATDRFFVATGGRYLCEKPHINSHPVSPVPVYGSSPGRRSFSRISYRGKSIG